MTGNPNDNYCMGNLRKGRSGGRARGIAWVLTGVMVLGQLARETLPRTALMQSVAFYRRVATERLCVWFAHGRFAAPPQVGVS